MAFTLLYAELQKGTTSTWRLFSDQQLFIGIFQNRVWIFAYHNFYSTNCHSTEQSIPQLSLYYTTCLINV